MRQSSLGLVLTLLLATSSLAGTPTPSQIREAAAKALGPLEQSAMQYPDHRDCFSCHHQAIPVLALSWARERGFEVPEGAIRAQVEFTRTSLNKGLEAYKKGQGQGGAVDTAGFALWTLSAGGHGPDELTEAVAGYLLGREKERPEWRASGQRPPSEGSSFTATYVALRGIKTFGMKLPPAEWNARLKLAKDWLIKTEPRNTEDRVFRLWGLELVDAGPGAIEGAVTDLLARQRIDGGWAQDDDLKSDAYATGSVLVALHKAGKVETSSKAYQKAVAFLISDQKVDGTWHVVSRSKPFQRYFESGFPYEKDQFISISASAWAASALVLATEPKPLTRP